MCRLAVDEDLLEERELCIEYFDRFHLGLEDLFRLLVERVTRERQNTEAALTILPLKLG